MKQRYFTASHNNSDVLKISSSGGVFTAITDEWFSAYGEKAVVYGCVMDENLKAKHIRAVTRADRDRMCGSKYISSDTTGIFRCILSDLNDGFFVLFSGTPCQIAGLKSYLSISGIALKENLLTVEVLCHGVGSNQFFLDYIAHLEKKYGSKAVNCKFRSKNRPGKSQDMQVEFANGKKYNASSTRYDWFYSAYMKNYILRPSCFDCRFAKPERNSDISVFDNWKEFHSNPECKHLSAVVVSSDFGFNCFEKSMNHLDYEEKKLEDISQPNLYAPSEKPADYNKFWELYKNKNGYMLAQKNIGNNTFKGYIRSFLIDLLYELNLTDTVKNLKIKIKRIIGR